MVIAPLPNSLNLLSTVGLTVRVGGKAHDPEINAQVANGVIEIRRSFRLGDTQIPHAVAPEQFRAADLPSRVVQIAALILAQDKLADHAACQGVQADPIQ